VVWGGAEVLRRLAEVVKWPFERIAWAIERGLVWPLEERTDGWSASGRNIGIAALVLLAAGAGVAGLVLASGSGSDGSSRGTVARATSAPTPAPVGAATAKVTPAAAAPVLQGAKPDFAAEADGGVAKSSTESSAVEAPTSSTSTAGSTSEVARSASSGDPAAAASEKTAGPAAIKIAHQFAGAFVLYEIGRKSDDVRSVFNETATPQLAHALLQRPPRQPAGTAVPKAKVLNVVPGPHHGDTYTLSVSLLRVGVTSELRLDMQRDPKTHQWQVTDALG